MPQLNPTEITEQSSFQLHCTACCIIRVKPTNSYAAGWEEPCLRTRHTTWSTTSILQEHHLHTRTFSITTAWTARVCEMTKKTLALSFFKKKISSWNHHHCSMSKCNIHVHTHTGNWFNLPTNNSVERQCASHNTFQPKLQAAFVLMSGKQVFFWNLQKQKDEILLPLSSLEQDFIRSKQVFHGIQYSWKFSFRTN